MKEEKKERSDSLLSLSRGGKRNRVLWREGEHSGAFIKILHCIQDQKWNAKQGWGLRAPQQKRSDPLTHISLESPISQA